MPAASGMTTKMTTDATSVSHGTATLGDAQQEAGDGREGEHHDQVVHRDLDQRVVGVAAGQVAPHEHHRGAGRHAQQDHARDVLLRVLHGHQVREHVLEEQHAERGHGERLDEPVDDEGERQARGAPAHVAQAARVHLQHHRVDHQPDEHGHHQVDARPLEGGHRLEELRDQEPEAHAGRDGERDPEREIAFEEAHGDFQGALTAR